MSQHQPVLCREVVEGLAIKPDGRYVDATFGRGGHSRAILAALSPQGRLLGIDRDPEAIAAATQLAAEDDRFTLEHAPFSRLRQVVEAFGWCGEAERGVDGILVDLGVSSPQLDTPARGFSFMASGPLDMRMDTTTGISAAEWLAQADEAEIATVLKEFGEERFHRRIAKAIVHERTLQAITTTKELAEIVSAANPRWEKHKHPATRTFQAIRVFINQELNELQALLEQSVDVLAVGGRLAAISFHSLEDRIVKRFIQTQSSGRLSANTELPRGLPVQEAALIKRLKKCGRGIRPSQKEIESNPRARSAILRIAEKLT